jgi:HK97 family phage major capsid protein
MPTQEILNRLNPGKFDAQRASRFDIERAKGALTSDLGITRILNFDENTRTAEFAFATDQPIEHWFGMLQLDVSKGAVDLSRVEAGVCPFLVNHDRDDQVGVVVPGSIQLGPVIRGTVKFSRSDRGEEILNDVKDEIRNGTSIGLLVQDLELLNEKEAQKGAIPMYRATKWTMLENSVASIPADIDCGAGRSLEIPDTDSIPSPEQRDIPNDEENKMTPEEIAAAEAAAQEQRSTELAVARRNEIVAFADIFGEGELAREMIIASNEVTVDDVRVAIRAKKQAAAPAPVVPPEPAAQAAARQGGVQLARTFPRVQLKAFTGPDAQINAYRSGMHLAAVLLRDENAIKYCRENGIALTRTQTGTENTKGGFTVLPEFEQTIFDLRLQYGVARRVVDVVPMASDTKLVTRRTGGLTAYPVGAGARGTYSTMSDDQFELVARKWMVLAKYEDELSEDSFINWADRLASEAAYAFTFSEDDCLFNGDGTSTYHGIVGITSKILGLTATRANIASAVVASGNAWSEIVIGDLLAVVGKLPSFARTSGNVRWYCTSEFWATVLQRLALAAGGATHAEFEGELRPSFLGKPVEIVEAMQHTEANDTIPLLYGNLAQAATFGDRRGVTIKMTDSNDTDFESDLNAIKATERFDINVHDVGNQSATAASRRPGPVIALLTAAS